VEALQNGLVTSIAPAMPSHACESAPHFSLLHAMWTVSCVAQHFLPAYLLCHLEASTTLCCCGSYGCSASQGLKQERSGRHACRFRLDVLHSFTAASLCSMQPIHLAQSDLAHRPPLRDPLVHDACMRTCIDCIIQTHCLRGYSACTGLGRHVHVESESLLHLNTSDELSSAIDLSHNHLESARSAALSLHLEWGKAVQKHAHLPTHAPLTSWGP